jgi:hypothetical protein
MQVQRGTQAPMLARPMKAHRIARLRRNSRNRLAARGRSGPDTALFALPTHLETSRKIRSRQNLAASFRVNYFLSSDVNPDAFAPIPATSMFSPPIVVAFRPSPIIRMHAKPELRPVFDVFTHVPAVTVIVTNNFG